VSGGVLWITGLPASGKTTLARELYREFESRSIRARVLDSDEARAVLTPQPSYSAEERALFYRALAYAAALLAQEGIVALVAATAHEEAYRQAARSLSPSWFLVYARCPLEVCEARDPKGLYRRARADPQTTLPGVGVAFEEPTDADAVIDTDAPVPASQVRALVDAFLARAGCSVNDS
jgi:adenylylsulfate kinase